MSAQSAQHDASFAVGKEPCPDCGSRDNLVRYSDGHAYCFSMGCGRYEPATGDETHHTTRRGRDVSLIEGEHTALPKRRINEETCRVWDYRVGQYNGKPVQIATYRNADGVPVAQKLRFADKSFKVIGDLKAALPLYGQHLWREGGKMVVITEGELDALSVSQLQSNRWPVVSVPNGAAGAAKAVSAALEWLLGFERVVIYFDDDEPGRKAARECAALLPPGRAYLASVPSFKDANEALVAGAGKALVDALWGARPWRPDGLVSVEDVIERAVVPVEIGLPWPWPALTEATHGRRRGELYGFGAGTGCGKTTLFKQIIANIVMGEGSPVGVLALEEAPHHTLRTIAGIVDGVRYHVPGTTFDPAVMRATLERMQGRVHLYDHYGAATFDSIVSKVRYMVHSLGCRDIFLDHITALAATIDEDERKAIDRMMADLAALVQELDITLYFISHLATPEGKAHEEGGRVQERHFRGSRSIAYWSHFLFGLERDKQKPDAPTVLRVLKDRYTGDAAGVTIGLRYDRTTGRMEETPINDCPFPDDAGGEF